MILRGKGARYEPDADNRRSGILPGAILPYYEGATDIAAELLFLTLSAVKKRWQGIYGRVTDINPTVLPETVGPVESSAGRRGVERRRYQIAYLRDHPEEIYTLHEKGAS